jgi:hypothetical protein
MKLRNLYPGGYRQLNGCAIGTAYIADRFSLHINGHDSQCPILLALIVFKRAFIDPNPHDIYGTALWGGVE